jgi:WD40 repeat protein
MAARRLSKPAPIITYSLTGGLCQRSESLTFSPDGEWVACVIGDKAEVGAWQTSDRERRAVPLTCPPNRNMGEPALAFAPGSDRLATARPKWMTVVEWPACRELVRFPRPRVADAGLEFLDEDHLLLSNENRVRIWNSHTGAEVLACNGDLRPICKRRGKLFGFSSKNKFLYAVNLQTRERTLVCGPVGYRSEFGALSRRRLQFTSDMRRTLVCTEYNPATFELWDLDTVSICGRVTRAEFGRYDPILSADGRYLAGENRAGNGILVWDTLHDCPAHRLALGERYLVDRFSPTHLVFVAIANWIDGQIDRTLFFDASTGVCLGETKGHAPAQHGNQFSPCGRWFASVVEDDGTYRWQPPPWGTVLLSDLQLMLARATPIVSGSAVNLEPGEDKGVGSHFGV